MFWRGVNTQNKNTEEDRQGGLAKRKVFVLRMDDNKQASGKELSIRDYCLELSLECHPGVCITPCMAYQAGFDISVTIGRPLERRQPPSC